MQYDTSAALSTNGAVDGRYAFCSIQHFIRFFSLDDMVLVQMKASTSNTFSYVSSVGFGDVQSPGFTGYILGMGV